MVKPNSNNNNQRPSFQNPVGTLCLRRVDLEDVVFINVESVPELPEFEDLTSDMQRLWAEASASMRTAGQSPADVYKRAGEMAEFGKAVCISVGVIRFREGDKQPYFVCQSYVGDDERDVLGDFSDMVDNFIAGNEQNHYLCGHGLRRCDIPFYARRMLINRMQLPCLFDVKGKRPLAASLIDTADFWAFSDLTSQRVSADLLANVFGVDTETGDYDSAAGADLYYAERDMKAICLRSERKALIAAQLMRRFRGEELISDDHVVRKNK